MSPNTQFILSFSIPSVLVILSWIQNNTRLSRLEAGQDALRAELLGFRSHVDSEFGKVREDMKQFYGMTTKLEGRMDELSKRLGN